MLRGVFNLPTPLTSSYVTCSRLIAIAIGSMLSKHSTLDNLLLSYIDLCCWLLCLLQNVLQSLGYVCQGLFQACLACLIFRPLLKSRFSITVFQDLLQGAMLRYPGTLDRPWRSIPGCWAWIQEPGTGKADVNFHLASSSGQLGTQTHQPSEASKHDSASCGQVMYQMLPALPSRLNALPWREEVGMQRESLVFWLDRSGKQAKHYMTTSRVGITSFIATFAARLLQHVEALLTQLKALPSEAGYPRRAHGRAAAVCLDAHKSAVFYFARFESLSITCLH